ncbi:flagellar filament capping protein FliD [Cellulomonas sp.]|uniref:flagellar filament capping protein FliD n=1 Tax=Cellulomonas sp. TaxID=40001 RepID=UPI002811DA08|nr:flagellar filament capping protein FliD [Cellulomonas sp.]
MAAIDGLVSGIKTAELIDSLLYLEAGNQRQLATKKATAQQLATALQALTTKVSSLAESATTASKPESWRAVTAKVDQPGAATGATPAATAVAGATATAGTLTFRVGAVAQSQASLVTLPAGDAYAGEKPTFTLTRDGETTTVTAESAAVPDLVAAFNASGTGVRATAVKVAVLDAEGKPTGESTYRLQLTGTETGGDNAFTLSYRGADGDVAVGLQTIRAAQDARVTLFPGSGAEQVLTSSSNTFEGVMTGVDLTVTAVTAADAQPLTLTVARDEAAVKKLASGLVANLNTVLSEISSRSKPSTTTEADGRTVVSGGLFAGDTRIRLLQQQVLSEASLPVDGVSPADVGIVIGRDGTFTFDDAVFTAALAKDPDQVQKVVAGVAERLAKTATLASRSGDGTLTLAVEAQQSTVRDLGDRISDWDDRLAMRRTSLERTYAALETTLSRLSSQSSYLASQIAALNAQPTK